MSEDHLLYDLFEDLVDTIFGHSEKITKDEILEDYDEIPREYGDIFEKEGYHFYRGYFADDGWGIEEGLCNTPLNIETEDFILLHEGGY
ncbi:MAG: hypothetical protein DRI57_20860 [Deltaproteobacteria bacterium]|nr:MAG: hypothetical protein DRI57_20860 [Deltaproteobacteria bacterium]